MTKKDHGRDLTGKEMCETLDEFANGASKERIAEFLDTLVNRTHRTLQQRIAGLMLQSIEAWGALPENRYDARNAATIVVCKKILAAIDKYDRQLPYI